MLNPALAIFSMVASCRLPLGNPNRKTHFFFMLVFNYLMNHDWNTEPVESWSAGKLPAALRDCSAPPNYCSNLPSFQHSSSSFVSIRGFPRPPNHPPAAHLDLAAGYGRYAFGIQLMLRRLNSLMQRFRRVFIQHGHRLLGDDWPRIHPRI